MRIILLFKRNKPVKEPVPFLLKAELVLIMFHVIRWTPELPFGVLQMADIFIHMEYSIWPYNFTIWSTPDVKIIEPYVVLHCSI